MGTLGNESFCEDKVWLAGQGDNGLCIIQGKICLPERNMPPGEKYDCLEKNTKNFFFFKIQVKICLPYSMRYKKKLNSEKTQRVSKNSSQNMPLGENMPALKRENMLAQKYQHFAARLIPRDMLPES